MELDTQEKILNIFRAFSHTQYGVKLASSIRYERYNLAGMPSEKWIKTLGVDVDNLWHMMLTYELARAFIGESRLYDPQFLSQPEEELVLIAAIIHDQGEAIVGDISYGDKNENDETTEALVLVDQQKTITKNLDSHTAELIQTAIKQIVFCPVTDNKLALVFNAIERVGYLRTGMRAYSHLAEGNTHSEGLRWLVYDVTTNHVGTLTEYAKTLPVVEKFLTKYVSTITDMLQIDSQSIIARYSDQSTTLANRSKSVESWQKFLNR
jgi:hypothetical protein